MRVVVTGGAGFIGSNLVEELAKRNEVIIIDDLSTGKTQNLKNLVKKGSVQFIKGSITNLDLLQNLFKDVDYVFHQASIPSVTRSIKDPIKTNEVNVKGTLHVLIASRDNNVKKVVYASSASVYGGTPKLPKREEMKPEPRSPYATSKLTGEYYCKTFSDIYGTKTVCLRYFNVYGPGQDSMSEYATVIPRFIKRVLSNRSPVIYGDGNQTRDFIFVKDVVRANILAMRKGEGVFNIACGRKTSINELAAKVIKMLGKDLKPVYTEPRKGDIEHSLGDISLGKKKLGYEPKYRLEEGLKETIIAGVVNLRKR